MPVARVNGIDIWHEFRGPEGAPLLVLTHGFAGPTEGWPPIIDEVTARYRVLFYDVRGHGKTTVPDQSTFSIPQFAADLDGLLAAVSIERAHIGGVSMGGMISAQFACDYPQRTRSLLLMDTTAGNQGDPATAEIERQVVEYFEQYEKLVRKHGLRGLVERENRYRHERDQYATKSHFSLEEQDARNNKKLERMTEEGYIGAARAIRQRPDLTGRTPSISAPALVSCGEWDLFYPCAERDHRLIPGSRFVTVRGAAHDTTNFTPQKWKRAIFEFIDDVEAGRPVSGELEYA